MENIRSSTHTVMLNKKTSPIFFSFWLFDSLICAKGMHKKEHPLQDAPGLKKQ